MKYVGWVVTILVCFVAGRVLYPPLGPWLLGSSNGTAGGLVQEVDLYGPHGPVTFKVDLANHPESELPERVKLLEDLNATGAGQDSLSLSTNHPTPPGKRPKPTTGPPTDPSPDAEDAQFKAEAEAKFPMPKFPPLLTIVDNWKKVPFNAYPKTITIKISLEYDVMREGEVVGRGELPVGTAVEPVELTGSTLKVSTISVMPTQLTVEVDQTDFKERVTTHYEESVKKRTESVLSKRAAERERLAAASAHEKKMATYNKGDDPRFGAVRESLRQGDAGFYQLDAASKWRWAGKETVDGVDYDVAFVMMASESAFGVIHRELKALIRDKKVAKWIDVSSGQEL